MQNAWSRAFETIGRIEKGMPVQEALAKAHLACNLDFRDRQLMTDLVNGYLRASIRIDFILKRLLKSPQKLPSGMLTAIGLGIYSLMMQDKVPDYAAVNNVVNLIKQKYGHRFAAVANGALRSFIRLGKLSLDPDWYKTDAADSMLSAQSIYCSIPQDITALWLDSYGEESTLQLLTRSAARPWSGIRINIASNAGKELMQLLTFSNSDKVTRIGKAGLAFPPGELPHKAGDYLLEDWHKKGAFSFQSPGSMQIMEELGILDWQEPIWDACAGFGSKSIALLERGAKVALASDNNLRRLLNLSPECKRLGVPVPDIMLADMTCPPVTRWAGNILLDVPCSGLGILSRRPDMRLRATKKMANMSEFSEMQKAILNKAASLLGEGREIAYITCTLNPAENENQIKDFLLANPQMQLVREWQTPYGQPFLEGMYGALLKKTPVK